MHDIKEIYFYFLVISTVNLALYPLALRAGRWLIKKRNEEKRGNS